MKKLTTPIVVGLIIAIVGFSWTRLASPASIPSGDVAAGLEVHKKHCLRCHGESGKGDGPATKLMKVKPTDWTDKEKMSQISPS